MPGPGTNTCHAECSAIGLEPDLMNRVLPLVPRVHVLIIVAAASAHCPARASDLLHSPECSRALIALAAEEDAIIARRKAASVQGPASAPRLQSLRRAAATACLGEERAGPPVPTVRPPPSAPGATMPPMPSGTAPRPSSTALAPVPQKPLLSITNCDANGCWASDGTRLQRQGTSLIGPRGYCSQVGTVLTCP